MAVDVCADDGSASDIFSRSMRKFSSTSRILF